MVDADGTYTYTYDNSDELTNVDKGGTQVESIRMTERQPDGDRLLDDGHERDADLAGRHLYLRLCGKHDQREQRWDVHDLHVRLS